MAAPTLQDVIEDLRQLSGTDIDPNLTLRELGVDSLELAEWVSTMQERFDVIVEERRLEEMMDQPVASIYAELLEEARRG